MKNPMSWVTWVVVIILLGTLVMQFFNGLLGVREVSMDQIMSVLKSDEKLSDVVLNDGDQVIRITTEAGQRIQSSWVGRQVDGFVEILQQRATAGRPNIPPRTCSPHCSTRACPSCFSSSVSSW